MKAFVDDWVISALTVPNAMVEKWPVIRQKKKKKKKNKLGQFS